MRLNAILVWLILTLDESSIYVTAVTEGPEFPDFPPQPTENTQATTESPEFPVFPPQPTENTQDCVLPEPPRNGFVDVVSGVISYFSCKEGHALNGTYRSYCNSSDGVWDSPTPKCIPVGCLVADAPENGFVEMVPGSNVSYNCREGYIMHGINHTAYCDEATGHWSHPAPECLAEDCMTAQPPLYGYVEVVPGLKANYSCSGGFELVGPPEIYCDRYLGIWNLPAPMCFSCPRWSPRYGYVIYATSRMVVYSCNAHDREHIVYCDGEIWAGDTEACLYDCSIPSPPKHGFVIHANEQFVSYGCDEGYRLEGSFEAYCEGGYWSPPSPPQCIGCLTPALDNGVAVRTEETVHYLCDEGFMLDGADIVGCVGVPRHWEHPTPKCVPIGCLVANTPENGFVNVSTGVVADYGCVEGYTLIGANSTYCDTGRGVWDGQTPKCIPLGCASAVVPENGSHFLIPGERIHYWCDEGYILDGFPEVYCDQQLGIWAYQPPRCSYIGCASPNLTEHSVMWSISGFKVGYYCEMGFTLNGTSEAFCDGQHGAWIPPEIPTCQLVECPPLANPVNGLVELVDGSSTYMAMARYHCLPGYSIVGVETRLCEHTGQWSELEPECRKDCPVPESPENGNVTVIDAEGRWVLYHCLEGFRLEGPAEAHCDEQLNIWEPPTPSCLLVECPPLINPVNGLVELADGRSTYMAVAIYHCLPGYSIVGVEIRLCEHTGQWSHLEPECRKDCPVPESPENGKVTVIDAEGRWVLYHCLEGFRLEGPAEAHCDEQLNIWEPPKPSCLLVDCGSPDIPENGNVYTNSTRLNGMATYFCNPGYTRAGSRFSICMATGSWSDTLQKCQIVECPTLSNPANGYIELANGSISYGATARYHCNTGYIMIGEDTKTCQYSGQWTLQEPRCQKDEHETCPEDKDARGTLWDEEPLGIVAVKDCYQFEADSVGRISRQCTMEGEWKIPFYNCTRDDFAKAVNEIQALLEKPSSSNVEAALSVLANATSAEKELYEGQIEDSLFYLETIVDISKSIAYTTEAETEAFFSCTSNLLDKKTEQSWYSIAENSEGERPSGSFELLSLIDTYGEVVAESFDTNETRIISRENMEIEIVSLGDQVYREDIRFPSHGLNHLFLPKESFTGSTSYISAVYKDLTGIPPETYSENRTEAPDLNSGVFALTLLPQNKNELKEPLQLTFKHLKSDYRHPICSYWNDNRNRWDSDGCILISSSDDVTICECSHLTNFAILMSPWVEHVDTVAIGIISYIGCCLSSLCLLITIGVHILVWRYVKVDRVVILINLSIALIISYIVFLAGVRQTDNEDACTAVAMILHYLYLVVFFLMLAEGIEIGVTVLYVFPTRSRLKWLLASAWGIPAVLVGISAGATKLDGYGTDSFCWLSTDNALIWAFVGPAFVIILINMVILMLVFRALFNTETIKKTTAMAKTKAGIRCLCVLLPLMGISWVLGVFYVSERTAWIQYVFAICNSLQGVVIFLFHCLFNDKVRTAIKNRQRRLSDSIPTSKAKPTTPFTSLDGIDLRNPNSKDKKKTNPQKLIAITTTPTGASIATTELTTPSEITIQSAVTTPAAITTPATITTPAVYMTTPAVITTPAATTTPAAFTTPAVYITTPAATTTPTAYITTYTVYVTAPTSTTMTPAYITTPAAITTTTAAPEIGAGLPATSTRTTRIERTTTTAQGTIRKVEEVTTTEMFMPEMPN